MPTIKSSQSGASLFSFQALNVLDEFIPFVKFDVDNYTRPKAFKVVDESTETLLNNVFDAGKKSFFAKHITTGLDLLVRPRGNREIKIPFIIEKGCSGTFDDGGKITVRANPSFSDVTIMANTDVVYKYGDKFNVSISVSGNQEREFYLEILASDDNDYFKGEMNNLLCGKVKITILGTSRVSLRLLENVTNLHPAPRGYSAPDWNTTVPSEIELSQRQANQYQNCEGVCYATCESRANRAYFDLLGRNVVNLRVTNSNIDHRIASTQGTSDPYMGYGAGGVFAHHGLGETIADDLVWQGRLRAGALLQKWNTRDSRNLFARGGHSVIFLSYRYDDDGRIDGIDFIDYHGGINTAMNPGVDVEDPWERSVFEISRTLLGVNLRDGV